MANPQTLPEALNAPTTHSLPVFRQVGTVLSQGLVNVTWSPLCRTARASILSYLSKVETGHLTIVASDETWSFGGSCSAFPDLKATLVVKSESFWIRVAVFTDIGLAEAFIFDDVDCDNLSALLKSRPPQILIINRGQLGQITSLARPLASLLRSLTVFNFTGAITNSRANISSHYDIGNIMFSAYLSKDMNYSSAIFRNFSEDLQGNVSERETLEEAQLRKMKVILRKANIQKGDKVLEIGTGWGSLAILVAQTVECTVVTITLSTEQTLLAQQRVSEAGLSERISIHNMDFRECLDRAEWKGAFDKFISIEMMEHVGKDYMREYWNVVNWAINGKTGVGVVQCITLPEARSPSYDTGIDFIQKWSMCFLTFVFIFDENVEATDGRLIVDSVHNIGPHYARTLREWRKNFVKNWDDIISVALTAKYQLREQELKEFQRKWLYYFDYCEAGFATRTLGDHCITFTREGNVAFGCGYEIWD
ncbi:hypothetical protein M422DRAFT_262765 [Sphaerobolus stellatus SS14]|uniref:Unplaced genomic scaffold SPHSTscaffold_118, whole genome shotgun sequence n=1 Tax=Sphaerobolus stellatus (strain SS14) TaxID=990650 RepID=A0A0C9V099_SPHS4|nr:hypothetical protein M422DRAFT_262765 [Sphaerobolus stellatus SS14]